MEEFVRHEGVPHVFFTASRQSSGRELALLAGEVADSDLPAAGFARGGLTFETWDAALTLVSSTADRSVIAYRAAQCGHEKILRKIVTRGVHRTWEGMTP